MGILWSNGCISLVSALRLLDGLFTAFISVLPVADGRGSIETACLYMIPTLYYLILGTLCLYGY